MALREKLSQVSAEKENSLQQKLEAEKQKSESEKLEGIRSEIQQREAVLSEIEKQQAWIADLKKEGPAAIKELKEAKLELHRLLTEHSDLLADKEIDPKKSIRTKKDLMDSKVTSSEDEVVRYKKAAERVKDLKKQRDFAAGAGKGVGATGADFVNYSEELNEKESELNRELRDLNLQTPEGKEKEIERIGLEIAADLKAEMGRKPRLLEYYVPSHDVLFNAYFYNKYADEPQELLKEAILKKIASGVEKELENKAKANNILHSGLGPDQIKSLENIEKRISLEMAEAEFYRFENQPANSLALANVERYELNKEATPRILEKIASDRVNNSDLLDVIITSTSGGHLNMTSVYNKFDKLEKDINEAHQNQKDLYRAISSNKNIKRGLFNKKKLDEELQHFEAAFETSKALEQAARDSYNDTITLQGRLKEIITNTLYHRSLPVREGDMTVREFLSELENKVNRTLEDKPSEADQKIYNEWKKLKETLKEKRNY